MDEPEPVPSHSDPGICGQCLTLSISVTWVNQGLRQTIGCFHHIIETYLLSARTLWSGQMVRYSRTIFESSYLIYLLTYKRIQKWGIHCSCGIEIGMILRPVLLTKWWPLQHPHGYMIMIFNAPCQFAASKVNGEATWNVEVAPAPTNFLPIHGHFIYPLR